MYTIVYINIYINNIIVYCIYTMCIVYEYDTLDSNSIRYRYNNK